MADRYSTTTALTPFHFHTHEIRIHLDDAGEPLWIAADVCHVLDIKQPGRAMSRLDADEKAMISIHTPGGMQEVWAVTEAGLYGLILGSRKKEAHEFKRWITHEVLPAILRTGSYTHPAVKLPTHAEALLAQAQVLVDHERQLVVLSQQVAAQDERLGAIETAYTPPAGKTWPQDWIVSSRKPRLDAELWKTFLTHARRLENAEPFTPPGGAFPRWYYTPATLDKAYALATRQMLLLQPRIAREGGDAG